MLFTVNIFNWIPSGNYNSQIVIIALTEVFDGPIPSKILYLFSWNPYFKTAGASQFILFLIKNFREKDIQFLKEWFCQKLPSNDNNNWANVYLFSVYHVSVIISWGLYTFYLILEDHFFVFKEFFQKIFCMVSILKRFLIKSRL